MDPHGSPVASGYETQRAWEKQDRELEDLKYEKDRAREDAERAAEEAARQRRECRDERNRHRESMDEVLDESREFQEKIARLVEINAELLAACESLIEWAKSIRDVRAAGGPVEAVEMARDAISRAKGK